jgi:hypothetical protein
LAQPPTYGASDVEDDLLFELEEEQFTIHVKRFNVKRKRKRRRYMIEDRS